MIITQTALFGLPAVTREVVANEPELCPECEAILDDMDHGWIHDRMMDGEEPSGFDAWREER